ncbi:hypothetical protein PO909_009714 [Leuciscus waleckii]
MLLLEDAFQGKPKTLQWTYTDNTAFQTLKNRLTSAPILHHPDPNKLFIVEVDASDTGTGAILSQRDGDTAKLHPCSFYSRKLSPAELNYHVGDKELLSIKSAFEEWRHWLEGAKFPFTVLTDRKNIEYILSTNRLNPCQARWSLFFTRFNFTVTYQPGSKNGKADALSRIYKKAQVNLSNSHILDPSLVVAPIVWDIMMDIEYSQQPGIIPTDCPAGINLIAQLPDHEDGHIRLQESSIKGGIL